MTDLLFFLAGLMLGAIIFRPTAHPLADHEQYMSNQYPDMMAFVRAEEKIDAFLLELEEK